MKAGEEDKEDLWLAQFKQEELEEDGIQSSVIGALL